MYLRRGTKPCRVCRQPTLSKRGICTPCQQDEDEPTMEELEATIAEAMLNRPKWWDGCYSHNLGDSREDGIRTSPRVVRCDRRHNGSPMGR